jgi:hypothetical protein
LTRLDCVCKFFLPVKNKAERLRKGEQNHTPARRGTGVCP